MAEEARNQHYQAIRHPSYIDCLPWWPHDKWREFLASRAESGKPVSDGGKIELIRQVVALYEDGHDVRECIDRTIIGGHWNIYVPRDPDPREIRRGA
jgi:hypothetical protein